MANSKIPNLAISDTLNRLRTSFNQLLDSAGDISTLETTATDLTSAINELRDSLNVIGSGAVTTDEKTLKGAINELDNELGTISSAAMGTTAGDVSGAIAELEAEINTLNTFAEPTQSLSTGATTLADAVNELFADLYTPSSQTFNGFTASTNFQDAIEELRDSMGLQGGLTTTTKNVIGAINALRDSMGAEGGFDTVAQNVIGAINELRDSIGATGGFDTVAQNVIGAINELRDSMGAEGGLTTTSKNIIGAINEHDTEIGSASLNTSATTLRGAINEHETDIGTVGNLTTTATNLTSAVNELDSDVGPIYRSATIPSSSMSNAIDIIDSALGTVEYRSDSLNAVSISDAINKLDDNLDTRTRTYVGVQGSTGLAYNTSTGTFSGVDATTSVKGVASFNSSDFSTTSGAVSIKAGGVSNAQLDNNTIAFRDDSGNSTTIALGATGFQFHRGGGIVPTVGTGDVTFDLEDSIRIGSLRLDHTLTTGGDVIVGGNLTINGTTTTVNTTDLEVEDRFFRLNVNETGAGVTGTYAGFEVDRGSETDVGIRWNETDNWFEAADSTGTYYRISTASPDVGNFLFKDSAGTNSAQTVPLGNDIIITGATSDGVKVKGSNVRTMTVSLLDSGVPTTKIDQHWINFNTDSGLAVRGDLGNTVTFSDGGGIDVKKHPSQAGKIVVAHSDTSTQASSNNSGRTYIQDVTLDGYGHVTGLATATETVTDTTGTNIVGASDTATANAVATNGQVHLNHIEGGSVVSNHNISGVGGVDVTSDANGDISVGLSTTVTAVTDMNVTGDFTVDASGDIILDAEGNTVIIQNGTGGDQVLHELADTGLYSITSSGGVTISSSGDDIDLSADGSVVMVDRFGAGAQYTFDMANEEIISTTDFTFLTGLNDSDTFTIARNGTGTTSGPILELFNKDTTLIDNQQLGEIKFVGEEATNPKARYASIRAFSDDVSAGTRDGRMILGVASNNDEEVSITMDGSTALQKIEMTTPELVLENATPEIEFSDGVKMASIEGSSTGLKFDTEFLDPDGVLMAPGGGNEGATVEASQFIGRTNAVGFAGLTETISFDDASHTLTLNSNLTITWADLPASGHVKTITLFLTSGASYYSLNWPSSTKWSNGVKPADPISGQGVYIYTFVAEGSTGNVYGFLAGTNFS